MDISKSKKPSELNRKLYTPQVDNFKNTQNHFYQYFNLKAKLNINNTLQLRKNSVVNNLTIKEPRKPSKDVLGFEDPVSATRVGLSITPNNKEPKSHRVLDKTKVSSSTTGNTSHKINLKKLMDQKHLMSKQSTLGKTIEEKVVKNVSKVITGKVTPLLQKQFKPIGTHQKQSLKTNFTPSETIYDKVGFYNSTKSGSFNTRAFSKTFREQNKENLIENNKLKTETVDDERLVVPVIPNKRYSLMFSNFFKKKEEGEKEVKISKLITEPVCSVFKKFNEKSDFRCLFAFFDHLRLISNEITANNEDYQILSLVEVIDKDALVVFVSSINDNDIIGDELIQFLKTVMIFFIVVVAMAVNKNAVLSLTKVFNLISQIFEYLLYFLYDHLSAKKHMKAAEQFNRWIKMVKLEEKFRVRDITMLTLKNATQVLNAEIDTTIKTLLDKEKHKIVSDMLKKSRNYGFSDCILKAMEIYENITCSYLLSESTISLSTTKDIEATLTNIYDGDDEPYFIVQPLNIKTYLPPKDPRSPQYTLVLDLDETLVHFQETDAGGQFLVRPYAQEFLELMSSNFELVVFTAAVQEYADWILDRIDGRGLIKHRLYRNHTVCQENVYIKDLSKLGRDLGTTIIIDNNSENFKLQPENGIYIKSWYDNPQDLALRQLSKLLAMLVESNPSDVRIALRSFQNRSSNGNKITLD